MDRVSGLAFISIGVLLQACAQQGSFTNENDNDAYLAESAVSSLNLGLADAERASSLTARLDGNNSKKSESFFAFLKTSASRSLAAVGNPGSCNASRYSPSLGSASCAASVGGVLVTSNFNCGVFQAQDQLLTGTITTTFDSTSTCNTWLASIPTSGSFTDTTSNFVRTTLDNSIVTTFTEPSANYNNVSIGGGVSVAFGSGTNSVSILGLKKTRVSSQKVTLFEHSVHTTNAISSSGSLAAGTRAIASGTVIVDHNVDQFTATGTISSLQWNSACCLPVTGTITFNLSGKKTGTAIVDFNTGACGEVKLTDNVEMTPPATKTNPSPTPTPSQGITTQTIGGCE
jgi:hypothetical protein